MASAQQVFYDEAFAELMGRVVAAIYQETDTKITALEAKIARLEAAMQEFKFVGQWQDFKTYKAGNFVSMGGQIYYANSDTKLRPGTDATWTLACKSGRDGRDGKDFVPQEQPEQRTVKTRR